MTVVLHIHNLLHFSKHTIFILEAESEGVIILLAAIHVSPLEARRFLDSLSSVNRMGKGCM